MKLKKFSRSRVTGREGPLKYVWSISNSTSLMRSQALSSGRLANDTAGDVVEEAAVGDVARVPGGEWVPPPNIKPGTTANSPRPDTGRVTGVHDADEK